MPASRLLESVLMAEHLFPEKLEQALKKGASANQRFSNGELPLTALLRKTIEDQGSMLSERPIRAFRALINAGARLDDKDSKGLSALSYLICLLPIKPSPNVSILLLIESSIFNPTHECSEEGEICRLMCSSFLLKEFRWVHADPLNVNQNTAPIFSLNGFESPSLPDPILESEMPDWSTPLCRFHEDGTWSILSTEKSQIYRVLVLSQQKIWSQVLRFDDEFLKSAESDDGETLLMQAACQGAMEVIPLLIERGLDIKKMDKNGNTAMDIAKKSNHFDVVSLLEKIQFNKLPNGGDSLVPRVRL